MTEIEIHNLIECHRCFDFINMDFILVLFLYLNAIATAQSIVKEGSKSKNPLPYFRRQVEEITEDNFRETVTEDSHTNIVSFLVQNLKEIFSDIDEKAEKALSTTTLTATTTRITIPEETTPVHIVTPEFLVPSGQTETTLSEEPPETDQGDKLFISPSKPPVTLGPSETREVDDEVSESPLEQRKSMEDKIVSAVEHTISEPHQKNVDQVGEVVDVHETITPRSCIRCNNVLTEHCVDPKNNLIPSVTCDRDSDLCYSQHTPFGIIERGCYNVNYNLTTYVCSCNLCNYLSISEMPFIFSKKQDWIDNVVELSLTRNFRTSIFKDMSCLRCEVNSTTKTNDSVVSLNCLEGNIGALSVQKCSDNEICGVLAVRNDGYIWRGCLSSPRYNYWWSLCDGDDCNHDPLLSVYEYLVKT